MGHLAYWIAWPGIWLYIQFTPPRTRVVILCNDKILLVKSWLGSSSWKLPGGGLHRAEQPLDGAVREVLEETAISLDPAKIKSLGKFKITAQGIPTDLIGFRTELSEVPALELQRLEITDAAWFSMAEIQRLTIDDSAQAVLTAFRDL